MQPASYSGGADLRWVLMERFASLLHVPVDRESKPTVVIHSVSILVAIFVSLTVIWLL